MTSLRPYNLSIYCCLIALFILFTSVNISAQVTLGTSPYSENFNGIGAGLPTGWTVHIGTTATALGSPGTFVNTAGVNTAWANTTGNFRNCASTNGSTAGDVTATQTTRPDRALSVRTSAAFGEAQHAFAFHIANTNGKYGFQLSFKTLLLNPQTKINIYQVDYGFGAAPTSFAQAAAPFTFTDLGINSGAWGAQTITINFGNALDNNSGDVWVRIANLSTTGTGNHCTFGIDDANLTWSTTPPTVTLASPNPAVPAGTVAAGTINKLIYRADVTVSNCSTSLTGVSLNTGGIYVSTDLVNLKLWYQSTATFNSATANLIFTKTTGLGGGSQSFSGFNQAYPVGTGYLFVTGDFACNAVTGNTINITAPNAANFVFGATVPTGTLFAGGTQTITGIAPSNVTGLTCTPGNSEIDFSWTNPACYDEIMIVATDDAGGVTSIPTGNGSQYTQNTVYNDGTNFVNLNPNEFCIYKGNLPPVTMTNLINGAAYYIKVFTRLGTQWSAGVTCSATPVPASNGDFRSISSGNWNDPTIWEKFSGTWIPSPGEYPNSQLSAVTIQAGTIVTLNIDNPSVKTLTINATGKLYCNTYTTNRFLSIFGSTVTCNGTIGNAPTQDYVCFNIESTTCTISGTGAFNCNRIRKNTAVNLVTNLVINMNITTWWNSTSAVYDAYAGDPNAFNITINAGKTLNCINGGGVAIDGTNGQAFGSSYGSLTVNGTLTVAGIVYMCTNNVAPYNCSVNIGATGIINALSVSMTASTGSATHTLTIASGGRLNINGTAGIIPFSPTGNIYNLNPGSTVEYSATGAEPLESGLSYSNLTISGSGTKTSNGNVTVGNTFLLTAGSFSQTNGSSYYTTIIAANGTLTGNGGNFTAGDAGGTLSFAGNGTINGTTALGFDILKINAGTVTNTVSNATCDSLNLTGGIFTIGTALTFNMLNNGVVSSTAGNFATGATSGILNFQGTGKFIGNSSPYDVYASGGVDFGTGTVTIQSGGSFRINTNGYANNNGCFYANNSTLVYNNGNTFTAGAEWYALVASGRGVPYNVQIGTAAVSNTKVSFGNSNAWRQMNGNLYIGPAAGGSGYGLILGSVYGGDVIIGGNWTRATTATFTDNTRAVTFNGALASTVAILGGGTEIYSYLIINKAAGVSTILSGAPNPTDVRVNGSGGSVIFQMLSGDLDLNQRTFNFTSFFGGSQNNFGIDGTAGNLTRNIISTGGTGIFAVSNSDAVTHFITITRLTANAALLILSPSVTMTTTGVGPGGGGINFGNTLTTINGTLQINTYGYVTGFAPTYGTNSFLVYNSGSLFDRNVEWGSLSGPGYPYHVVVQNGTNIRLNTPATNGNADRAIAGNLSIVAGSSLLLSTTAANTLTVGKNVILDGTLTLPTVIGGDLYLGGNWNRSASGVFTPNNRAVFFNGTTASTITASGGQLFPYLYLTKNVLATTLTLLDDIFISKEFSVTSGTFDLATKNATLKSDATGTADFGKVGATGDVTYSGAGRFIVERYIPTGTLAGQHLKTWQLLAVPDNGGQTINAGWQEGNVLPTIGVTGLGTIITNNTAGAGFDIIGGTGPSLKTFNPLTATWTGVANTTPTALFNKKGYFLFVRGDRNASTYNAPATTTTLRSTGKLFVPNSNPPASTTVLAGKFETIGNPYASAIDFLNITKPAAPAVDDVFYVWDPLLYGYYGYGGYQTMSSVTGYKPTPGGTANYSSAVSYTKIQSGQAFFVHATGAGGTVSFTENAKLPGSNLVFKPSINIPADFNKHFFRAELYTSTGSMADANVVAFSQAFDNAYEADDALKILNAGENFGISSNQQTLAVEARQPVLKGDTIHYTLGNLQSAATYQLRFAPENMGNTNLKAWLVDKFLSAHYPVSLADSSFFDFSITPDPASAATDRFMIVFKRKKGFADNADSEDLPATGLNNQTNSSGNINSGANGLSPDVLAEISVYPNPVVNKTLQLVFRNKPAGNYRLQLINTAGQIVYEKHLAVSGNYFQKSLPVRQIVPGYYSLVILGEDGNSRIEGIVIE